ncbi:MAG: NADH-quinone oxidoreductase subunit NuoK [Gammaproteobacteria bacterium]|nr:NADH-quinone oxidoreductase subunit NuoK [Gammaproteobacteria bacterium]
MINLSHFLILGAILFCLGLTGFVVNRKNLINLLMCVELLLLAVNFNLIAFSNSLNDISGQVFVFFILTVAAAEAAIGLAILMVFYRHKHTIAVAELDELKG